MVVSVRPSTQDAPEKMLSLIVSLSCWKSCSTPAARCASSSRRCADQDASLLEGLRLRYGFAVENPVS